MQVAAAMAKLAIASQSCYLQFTSPPFGQLLCHFSQLHSIAYSFVSLHHVRPWQFSPGLSILPQRTIPNNAGCTISFVSLCFTHWVSFLSLVVYSFQQASVHLLPSFMFSSAAQFRLHSSWAAKVLLHSSAAYKTSKLSHKI